MYKRLTTLASLKATLIGENLKKKVKDGKYTILMQTFVDENQALMMTFSKARNGILSIVSPPPPSQLESRSLQFLDPPLASPPALALLPKEFTGLIQGATAIYTEETITNERGDNWSKYAVRRNGFRRLKLQRVLSSSLKLRRIGWRVELLYKVVRDTIQEYSELTILLGELCVFS